MIDEVRIYNRALTATEIQQDMATAIGSGTPDTTPPSIAITSPSAGTVSGTVTVTVQRASDGVQVRSATITDGHFKFRLKRGTYDVSSVPPVPPACEPPMLCPAQGSSGRAAIVAPCEMGETQRVQVRRHRFAHVDLQVHNVCIV